ncbi:MAG TPA: hypothetical protein VGD79_07105 [Thermoanaerobaculia bacterium]|jgi:hypothetical protein
MNNLAIDPLWIWVAVGVVGLLIVVGLVTRGARRSRSESLRNKFGNEYDHAVHEHGSRKKAERDLIERAETVKKYNIVPLQASDRNRFRTDWQKVEQHFIERPTTAVVEADELVADIMRTRGYPMGDFDRHAADLSVTHPSVIEHYRAGHRAIGGAPGSASTEDLRQAMLHYRALFDELIDDRVGNDVVVNDVPRANEVPTTPRRDVRADDELRRRP